MVCFVRAPYACPGKAAAISCAIALPVIATGFIILFCSFVRLAPHEQVVAALHELAFWNQRVCSKATT
eukprot:6464432-Amphidinium_carterae.3